MLKISDPLKTRKTDGEYPDHAEAPKTKVHALPDHEGDITAEGIILG